MTANEIQGIVKFAAYNMLDKKRSNAEDVILRIVLHIGVQNILDAYEVSMTYPQMKNISNKIAVAIITDLMNQFYK